MQYRPEAKDLLQSIQELLIKEVIPKIQEDELLSYKTLVSWNMLGVLIRELEKEEEFLLSEYKSFETLILQESHPKLSEEDFKSLSQKEKLLRLRNLNNHLATDLRASEKSDITSMEWKHIKMVLKNNLSVSNPRFNV